MQRILNTCALLVITGLTLSLCIFAVGNSDFWWHIKAGQVMRELGSLIYIDPFAFTREDLPYLASHAWLAQIILSLIFDAAGSMGIIVLRCMLVLATFLLLLTVYPKRIWMCGFLVVVAATAARPSIADRPQLWTLLLFSGFLLLCLQYLDASERRKKAILILLLLLQLLWVNLHGAAAVMGIVVVGALILQNYYRKKEVVRLLCIAALLFLLLVASPLGFGNLTYLWDLFSDQTKDLIAEWHPSDWKSYLKHFWLLWLLSIATLFAVRRHWIFCAVLMLTLGVLSRSAGRHEMLLAVTLTAVIFHQLKYSPQWNRLLDALLKRAYLAPTIFAVILLGTWQYSTAEAYDTLRRDHLFGTGMFTPMQGAYAFLERENVTGPGFNSYEAGGELLYLGYPDRKVFIDGRNVDYGTDLMRKTLEASSSSALWKAISEEYGFTHAIIALYPYLHENGYPYAMHLEPNPNWILVYVDDWSAVYAKNIPENTNIIANNTITMNTPLSLYRLQIPKELTVSDLKELESELLRIRESSPLGIRATTTLARLYASIGLFDRAEELLAETRAIEPLRFEILLLTSDVYASQDRYKEAATYLDKAIDAMGHTGVVVDWNYAATLHAKAGNEFRARWYRLKAK